MADEEEFDVETDDGDNEDEEQETQEQEEFKPPTQEEWLSTQNALKKANEQAKKYRLAAKQGKKSENSGEGDSDAKIAAKAAELAKPRIIRSEAKSALIEAGGKNIKALTKLLDLDELDVDDDEVVGLDDEIDRLREEYPELFKSEEQEEKPKRRPGRVDAGRSGKGTGSSKSSSELQAEGIFGRR